MCERVEEVITNARRNQLPVCWFQILLECWTPLRNRNTSEADKISLGSQNNP